MEYHGRGHRTLSWSLGEKNINISKKSEFLDFHLKEKCESFFLFPFFPWVEVFLISFDETLLHFVA